MNCQIDGSFAVEIILELRLILQREINFSSKIILTTVLILTATKECTSEIKFDTNLCHPAIRKVKFMSHTTGQLTFLENAAPHGLLSMYAQKYVQPVKTKIIHSFPPSFPASLSDCLRACHRPFVD